MNFSMVFLAILSLAPIINAKIGDVVDCSAAYYETSRKVKCEIIACSATYETFLGSWEGPFTQSEPGSKKKREYRNQVTYSKDDCLKNVDSTYSDFGDEFIIGRQIDIFPAVIENGKVVEDDKISFGLLITGKNASGKPFLRTVNTSEKRSNYSLVSKDEATVTSIWSLFAKNGYCDEKSGQCFDLKFTTFDGQDMAFTNGKKRNVRVSMEVFKPGTQEKVLDEPALVSGYHILQK